MTVQRLLAALLVAAPPQTACATSIVGGQDGGVSLWRVAGSLLLCLGLGVAAVFLLHKRYGSGPASPRCATRRSLRVAEQQALGAQRSIALIEVDQRRYLALMAPGAAALLALDAPASPMPETDPV